ncbi:MAG TPA: hypothetical protein VGK20_15640 [Candidatus Binatia bacterium]|jgi:hypothetical protein
MIIDEKSFLDLAVHLRHASENLVVAARRLSRLCDPACKVGDDRRELVSTLDSLVTMNREFHSAEQLIRALWDANHETGARIN